MASRRRTKQLADWDHAYLWHPFTQMREWEQEVPLIIERASGSYLIDTNGRKYLDGVSSIWVNVHGHRHPVLDRAILGQLKKVAHSTLLGLSNPPAIELARELVRLAPKGLTRVFYSDDGSTAMEVAMKMAVQYWQQQAPRVGSKRMFLHLRHSYHGDTSGAMSVGGIELFRRRFRSLLVPTLETEPTDAARMEQILRRRHRDLAAVVIEPMVQAAAGMMISPPGYLSRIRRLCTRYNVLLIADEVATGFGRTGRMFACEHENVTPDLMAISKGLTGGYMPLAATLATDKIYRAFLGRYTEWKTFFHGHSYTGNPLGCAVALANLKVFRSEKTLVRVRRGAASLSRLLTPMARLLHVGDIRQLGYMVGIDLVRDRIKNTPYPLEQRMGHRVAMETRRRGMLIRPLGNVIVLMPSLRASPRELATMVRILHDSIRTVTSTALE